MLKKKKLRRKIYRKYVMLCCGRKKGREGTSDIATSPRRQHGGNSAALRPKEPPSMVVQGDFRKVSGISNEIFRQIETIENDYDASTAAALESVERRGEMIVRYLDIRNLGKEAANVARKFLNLQDSKYSVRLVEIIKRPGQTLGLYIREGNGIDRLDGVFVSRVALESAVYNSGCLQVGDEILAVNLVDVTRISIDDVVIIMSIPRRLILTTRQLRVRSAEYGPSGIYGQQIPLEPKPPPVVVIKKDTTREEEDDDDDEERPLLTSGMRHETHRPSPSHHGRKSRSHMSLDSNDDIDTGLYYNSRPPEQRYRTLDHRDWSYKSSHDERQQLHTDAMQHSYSRTYPKTLESLAEKVHPFCPGGSTLGRRTSEVSLTASRCGQYSGRRPMMRSGSDQHLPRTEYDDFSRTLPARQSHTLLRSSLRSAPTVNYFRQYGATASSGAPTTSSMPSYSSSLPRRRNVDYSSDTETSYRSSDRQPYYYGKPSVPSQGTPALGISSSTLSRLNKTGTWSKASLRSNSLPRDTRAIKNQLLSMQHAGMKSRPTGPTVRFDKSTKPGNGTTEQEDSDGIYSAPETLVNRRAERSNIPSSSSVFTSDEYRAWLSRTPSTSAIYERVKLGKSIGLNQQQGRFTFSAENLPEKMRQFDFSLYSNFRASQLSTIGPLNTTPLPSATVSTLDRHTRTASLRRMKHLQELEAKHLGSRTLTPGSNLNADRTRVLEINTSEFTKYRRDRVRINEEAPFISGLLWIHLLAGRGLKVAPSVTSGQGFCPTTRDLYCVLECDKAHKARTVVRNGDLAFDWDETFELDIVANRELDFLVYSWDPQHRHKLCYKGSVHLATLLQSSPLHHIALKMEPRGTLYFRLRHTNVYLTYLRKPSKPLLPSRTLLTTGPLFGADLESVVLRESGAITGTLQSVPKPPLVASVPIIVRKCVEEVQRRGLDIIGIYRLCGSATKKRILKEAFEKNVLTVDLSPNNVPDINVVTGLLKDYLRELPEPLFTKYLYQMIIDALSVCLSDDPEGNAKLIFSLLDCLPRSCRATLIYVMDHLSLITSQSASNKMTPQNLSIIFAPLLIIQSELPDKEIDFNQPINILRYLLEVWPSKSVREIIFGQGTSSAVRMAAPPPLPKKPSGGLGASGGPLPVPSRGIRKPPPAIPARHSTPVTVTVSSPINESISSSSTTTTSTSSSSSDETVDTQIQVSSSVHYHQDTWRKEEQTEGSTKPPKVPARRTVRSEDGNTFPVSPLSLVSVSTCQTDECPSLMVTSPGGNVMCDSSQGPISDNRNATDNAAAYETSPSTTSEGNSTSQNSYEERHRSQKQS